MRLACVHCGKPFTITADQLGGRGRCPNCQGEIRLPEAVDNSRSDSPSLRAVPSHWWENSISGLVSLVFHMLLLLVFALISYDVVDGGGGGEEVLIGDIPSMKLGEEQADELSSEVETAPKTADAESDEMLEVAPPIEVADDPGTQEPLAVVSPSTSSSPSLGRGDIGSFDLGTVSAGGGGGPGGDWTGMLRTLRERGLDIVVCFDSTGSMAGEIREVKEQIRRIGETLVKLIPKARISICTYRDEGDEYVVKGLPLTEDIQAVAQYLSGIDADAGGDLPEAVHKGLHWSVENNSFRSGARKVVLLFGDAPPHRQDLEECLRIASDFVRQKKGIVSTVTCRRGIRLREFEEIAQMGGGEAFLTTDERQIVTQLLVLVFGSSYRQKVIEAFRLLDR